MKFLICFPNLDLNSIIPVWRLICTSFTRTFLNHCCFSCADDTHADYVLCISIKQKALNQYIHILSASFLCQPVQRAKQVYHLRGSPLSEIEGTGSIIPASRITYTILRNSPMPTSFMIERNTSSFFPKGCPRRLAN
jgi:hypothetical protein